MDARLNFLQKIGDRLSEEYSINWESWEPGESERMEKEVQETIEHYEQEFEYCMSQEVDEDSFDYINEILEELLSGYTLRAVLNRKKAIEELLVTV